MGIENTHSTQMLSSLLVGAHLLTQFAGSHLPSFLTGNVPDTARAVFDEMPNEPTQTFTDQASNVEQIDTGFSEEAMVFGTFTQTAQTVATFTWNYLPYVAAATTVVYLGYKAYSNLSRPTVEVINNNITINIKNQMPETIEIQPVVKEVATDKGKEMRIDLNVTPLIKTVNLVSKAAATA